jgi:hypothetical protein
VDAALDDVGELRRGCGRVAGGQLDLVPTLLVGSRRFAGSSTMLVTTSRPGAVSSRSRAMLSSDGAVVAAFMTWILSVVVEQHPP